MITSVSINAINSEEDACGTSLLFALKTFFAREANFEMLEAIGGVDVVDVVGVVDVAVAVDAVDVVDVVDVEAVDMIGVGDLALIGRDSKAVRLRLHRGQWKPPPWLVSGSRSRRGRRNREMGVG